MLFVTDDGGQGPECAAGQSFGHPAAGHRHLWRLAVALIWLGIGSIKARRWARALLLIFSWSWLVMGVCMTAVMPFFMAKVMANLPPNAKTGQPAHAAGSHHRHGHRHDNFLLRVFCPRAGALDILLRQPPCERPPARRATR
jgi:hypothetical protein